MNPPRRSWRGISTWTIPIGRGSRSGVAITTGLASRCNCAPYVSWATFLSDPREVTAGVAKHLAAQLAVGDPACLKRYLDRPATHREHAGEIQRRLGYRDFSDQPEQFRLVRWLYTRAWLSAERPTVLFDLTTARLIERKVLLPGVTVFTRLVAQVRDRAASRPWPRMMRWTCLTN